MEPWYTGAVIDAVREAKTRRALFIVYVHDDSEQSDSLAQLWSTIWTQRQDTSNMVVLRLSKDTEACGQFISIYKVQTYPTTYFINGQNGQALKIVDYPIESADQLEQIITESLEAIAPPVAAEAAPTSAKTVEERVIGTAMDSGHALVFLVCR